MPMTDTASVVIDTLVATFQEAGAILLIACAVINAVLVVLGIRRYCGRFSLAGCGSCSHVVHSLASGRCGECGGDFVSVGIQKGCVRQGFSTWLLAVLLLILGGMSILVVRGLVRTPVDVLIPATGYMAPASWVVELDEAIFPATDENGVRVPVSVLFTRDEYWNQDYDDRFYAMVEPNKRLELFSGFNSMNELARPIPIETRIDVDRIKAWFEEAGVLENAMADPDRFESTVQMILDGTIWFRENMGGTPPFELKSHMVKLPKPIQRLLWIEIAIDGSTLLAMVVLAAGVGVWVVRRTRRIKHSRGRA